MPIERVTDRGQNGSAQLHPGSHVLTKAMGGTITASWDVRNNGTVAAFGFLEMGFSGTPGVFQGDAVQIPGGATATLFLSGVINTLVAGTTYAGQLQIRAFSPGTVGPGSTHNFTLTISTQALPKFAVGQHVKYLYTVISTGPLYCFGVIQSVDGFFTSGTGSEWYYTVAWDAGNPCSSAGSTQIQESALEAA